MDKHTTVRDWLKSYPGFNRLCFNFGTVTSQSKHLIPTASDYVFKRDIFGNAVRYYDFAITAFNDIDDITDDGAENLVDFNQMQNFIDWIAEQNSKRDFPSFGDNCEVEEIRNLQNARAAAASLPNTWCNAGSFTQNIVKYAKKERNDTMAYSAEDFNLSKNQKAERKLLVTCVNMGDSIDKASGTPKWLPIGVLRIQRSSIIPASRPKPISSA